MDGVGESVCQLGEFSLYFVFVMVNDLKSVLIINRTRKRRPSRMQIAYSQHPTGLPARIIIHVFIVWPVFVCFKVAILLLWQDECFGLCKR